MSDNPSGADEQNLVVNQLIAEFMSRTGAGEILTPDQFLTEHPEQAAELKRHFANVNDLESLIQTDKRGAAEKIVGTGDVGKISTKDASAHTVVSETADSETSVTRDHKYQNTGSSTNIEIPETFGRYVIQKVLGQGAMGAVYLAKDTQLDRNVALKIPKFGNGNGVHDEELLERFYREARASATIRSLNICPVFDVGEIDGQHYITMAFIEGRPLKDFTKPKKPHSEKKVISIIRKLALGLAEAHKIGVIHRDLKPANIMVDLKGEPVVMDFGLARRSASEDVQMTQSGAILGTPAYMSPEQVEGVQETIGPQTDIYALGVIMYELITDEMPFKGSLISILQLIALSNPQKPSELRKNIDPRLETICLKMMAGDQTKRYQSMTDVAADLQDVLRNSGKRQKKEQAKQTESKPALISVAQPKSYTDKLRKKKNKIAKKAKSESKLTSKSATTTSSESTSSGPLKKLLIAGGVGGLLLLGIIFFIPVSKYDVQITLDDPSITLSVDGEVLKITDDKEVYKLSAGEHRLQLQKDGLTAHTESFTVTNDGKTALRAAIINGQLDGLLNGDKPKTEAPPSIVSTKSEIPTSPLTQDKFALAFDGVDDLVNISSLEIDGTRPLTLEAIVTIDEKQATVVIASTFSEAERVKFVSLFYKPNIKQFGFYRNEQRAQFEMTSVGKRFAIAGVWDGKELRVYLDGRLVSSRADTNSLPASTQLTIGAELIGMESGALFMRGQIEEFRVSQAVRYQSDYSPQDTLTPDNDTLALYHFDEGTGEILKDSSGNGNDGKIVGAKWVRIDTHSSQDGGH